MFMFMFMVYVKKLQFFYRKHRNVMTAYLSFHHFFILLLFYGGLLCLALGLFFYSNLFVTLVYNILA